MTKNNNITANCPHEFTMWTVDISQPPPLTQYDKWCTRCGEHLETEHSDYCVNDDAIGVDYTKYYTKSDLKSFLDEVLKKN